MVTSGTIGRTGYWVRSRAITSADANTTARVIEVPAQTFVAQVVCIVTVALDGGTPSLDIGDGDNDDGWVDTTNITETSPGTYAGTVAAGAAYLGGKYYAAADTIDAVVATGLTAGTAYVLAYFIPLVNEL